MIEHLEVAFEMSYLQHVLPHSDNKSLPFYFYSDDNCCRNDLSSAVVSQSQMPHYTADLSQPH